eukprot:TRINITY_DN12358_c0_g1_i1.p1 TRINITY_DN12358_c0_g1~~TRINITY_DN12358_c0_g1_i1.p1  ORF type:complete len:597 (+),score=222.31 TRINITY_DN12358_c0_g1_i1:52-1842(+)
MEVDATNFAEGLLQVQDALSECDFVAVDLEMTGISLPHTRINVGDLTESRYTKYRDIVSAFGIMQVGIACFTSGASQAKAPLTAKPFNFYVFPRSIEDLRPQHIPKMAMCASSMGFHRSNEMDFNRWISHGIQYVTAGVEETLRRRVAEEASRADKELGTTKPTPAAERIVLQKPQDKAAVDEAMKVVAALLEGGGREAQLPHLNPFLAKAMHQRMEVDYPDSSVWIDARRYGDQRWQVHRFAMNVDAAERKRILTEKVEASERRAKELIGFRRVWTALCRSGKPLALHNGSLDLLFLFHHLEAPLPETLAEFKAALSLCIPSPIYDTKVLSETFSKRYGFKHTALGEVVSHLEPSLRRVAYPAGFGRYAGVGAEAKGRGVFRRICDTLLFRQAPPAEAAATYHEAGYDALQTGRLYDYFSKEEAEETRALADLVSINRAIFRLAVRGEYDPCVLHGYIRVLYDFSPSVTDATIRALMEPFCKQHALDTHSVELRWSGDRSAVLVVHRSRAWHTDPTETGRPGSKLEPEEAGFSEKLSAHLRTLVGCLKSATLHEAQLLAAAEGKAADAAPAAEGVKRPLQQESSGASAKKKPRSS